MDNRGPTKNNKGIRSPLAVRTPAPKFNPLKAIKCLGEVEEMLQKGHSTVAIARFIQDEKGELLEMQPESVAARLREWRATMPPLARISQIRPDLVEEAIEDLQKGMDECKELRGLLAIQKKRIEQARSFEANGQVTPQTGREIQLAIDIIAKHAEIRVSLGLGGEGGEAGANKPLEQQLTEAYGDEGERVKRVLESPSSRRKLLGMMEKVRSLAAIGHGTQADSDAVVEGKTSE